MQNYYVNGSLTNYIQGAIGFNTYQGSIVLQPFNDDLPWLLELNDGTLSEIGFSQEEALRYVKALLRGINLYPLP